MDHTQHNGIVSFLWGIADDVLRDVYVRGKYRDVILPMTVIRRLDALLEPTKEAVLKMKAQLDKAKIANQEAALRKISKHSFYNTSQFTLRRLLDNPKQLRANFTDYLDGFSPNVTEIIEKFDFRNQLKKLDESDVLGHLITKFLDPNINLSPQPVLDGEGKERLPGLTNHGMSAVYEELLRLGTIREDKEGMVHLVEPAFTSGKAFADRMFFFGENLEDHAAAAVTNVLADTPPFLERAVFSDELSAQSVEALSASAHRQWQVLHDRIVEQAIGLEAQDIAAGRPRDHRFRAGVYVYSDQKENS